MIGPTNVPGSIKTLKLSFKNLPYPPPPHKSPHHRQSRGRTSFSAVPEAAAEPWPSQAFNEAADPALYSPSIVKASS